MSVYENRVYDHLGSDLNKKVKPVPSGRPRNRKLSENGEGDDVDMEIQAMLNEFRTELNVRKREEDILQKEIAQLLSNNYANTGGEQSRAFGMAVSKLNNHLVVVENDAKNLATSLATISRLADNISGKVCALDVAKNRVVECLQLAGDMRDLGTCSEGIDEAIRNDDFETAAQYIHRFLTLDQAVFQVKDSKDAGQSVMQSYEVLMTASTRLKSIIEKRLEDSVATKNVPDIQRFVKLFPLINQYETGLALFSKYVTDQIVKLGDDTIKIMNAGGTDDTRLSILYADTLFLFLDGIAGILDSSHSMIFSSYGSDRILDFLNMVQNTIDSVVEKIVSAFTKKRQISSVTKLARTLHRDGKSSKAERVNPLELDVLLNELCLMISHAETYARFVRKQLADDQQKEKAREEENEESTIAERNEVKEKRQKKLDQLLVRSRVGTIVQELSGQYISLENCYMEECFTKAIEMDAKEEGLTSSVVDDTLFLVRKCVRRAMTSGSIDCVTVTLNNGSSLLETSFLKHLEKIIKAGYPTSGFASEALQTAQAAYNVIQTGGKGIVESASDLQRDAFLTAANNARGAAELISKLSSILQSDWTKKERSSVEAGKLEHSLSQLEDVAAKFTHLANLAMESLTSSAVSSLLKTSCETYIDLPHDLSESQFNEFEAVDPFIDQFTATLDKIVISFEKILHTENFKTFLLVVCGEVARQMERAIMKCSFNRLGALQLDREFRSLSAYLSSTVGWSARERIHRLAQIVGLLNVETVEEARELYESGRGGGTGEFTGKLVKKVLLLRNDISSVVIGNLQL